MAAETRAANALEATRKRLLNLTDALFSLRRDIEYTDTLPPWNDIQHAVTLIARQLDALCKTTADYDDFLSTAHAYPLPTFPRPAQETVLGPLLRTKLDPSAEEWVEQGSNGNIEESVSAEHMKWSSAELAELRGFAVDRAVTLYEALDKKILLDYTLEELNSTGGTSSVVTGIRRQLDDGNESEDDDDDDDDLEEDEDDKDSIEDGDQSGQPGVNVIVDTKSKELRTVKGIEARPPIMPIEDLLKYASTGLVPRQPVRTTGPRQ